MSTLGILIVAGGALALVLFAVVTALLLCGARLADLKDLWK